MRVKLTKDCSAGKEGQVITGPEVWRRSFSPKQFSGIAADAEAAAAVLAELNTLSGACRDRLIGQMRLHGTYPPDVESFAVKQTTKGDDK